MLIRGEKMQKLSAQYCSFSEVQEERREKDKTSAWVFFFPSISFFFFKQKVFNNTIQGRISAFDASSANLLTVSGFFVFGKGWPCPLEPPVLLGLLVVLQPLFSELPAR